MRSSFTTMQLGLVMLAPFFVGAAIAQEKAPAAASDPFDVKQFGAVGDGKTDDTAAFQQALDAADKAGGGVVHAPRGNYFFAGHLNVPNAVTLAGVWESVPAHNGIRDRNMPKPTDDGTTFLVTEGAGSEDGPAFITLNTNCTLKGVVLYYPQQNRGRRAQGVSLRDCHARQEPGGAGRGDAQSVQRHRRQPERAAPDSRRAGPAAPAGGLCRFDLRHRPDRERPFQPLVEQRKPKLQQWQMENGEAFIFAGPIGSTSTTPSASATRWATSS